jgi:hypothetical protein
MRRYTSTYFQPPVTSRCHIWSRRVEIDTISLLGRMSRHSGLRGSQGHGTGAARLRPSGWQGRQPVVWKAATDPLLEPPTRADDDIELLAPPDAVERIVQRAEAKGRLVVPTHGPRANVYAQAVRTRGDHAVRFVTGHARRGLGRRRGSRSTRPDPGLARPCSCLRTRRRGRRSPLGW